MASLLGVKENDLPCIIIADTQNQLKKYKMTRKINEQNINTFISDWESGKLKQYLRSQDPPTKNLEAVKIVVGKTFDEIVLDNTKDVFIVFYSPKDNDSRSMARLWDELAFNIRKACIMSNLHSESNSRQYHEPLIEKHM